MFKFIFNLFRKDPTLRLIESEFESCMESGYSKRFEIIGAERTFVLTKNEIKIVFIWFTRGANPQIQLFCNQKETKLKSYDVILSKCPEHLESEPSRNYWIWNSYPIQDYLNEFKMELFQYV